MGPTERKFWKFKGLNPSFSWHFNDICMKAKNAGYKKFSAHLIIQQIRWLVKIKVIKIDDFKICNDLFPYYARWWMKETGIGVSLIRRNLRYLRVTDFNASKAIYGS